MSSARKFELHPQAAEDITKIWEYIAKDNPRAAGQVREDILNALHTISDMPQSGITRRDLSARRLRFKLVRSYLIAYAPDERPLLILAVLHTRRNPKVMRAILKSRQ
jgi:plasmid stabilization system protein ParE